MNALKKIWTAVRNVWIKLSNGAQRVSRFVTTLLIIELQLVLLIVVVGAVTISLFPGLLGPSVKQDSALVLDLKGRLVEERSSVSVSKLLTSPGEAETEVQLRDVLRAIKEAAKDEKIKALVLDLQSFQGGGLASLREVGRALDAFKQSGKSILTYGQSFDQGQYFLAAHADEIYLHPMGMVALEGFGRYQSYYAAALAKLGVTVNVVRVGSHKNAAEFLFAKGPSKETQETSKMLYGGLWSLYTAEIERLRKLPAGSITAAINDIPKTLPAEGFNLAQFAKKGGLVTAIMAPDEFITLMKKKVGEEPSAKSFRKIGYQDYLEARPQPKWDGGVAVIVAQGNISDGIEKPGAIGGKSTSALIEKARQDERVKAIVLRVNSPGGSALGSELIRRELELTRAAGKPVIVSMGDVAASGGYWISLASDGVVADAATITGSIGVFGIFPTFDKAMQNLSINTEGYGTTWLKGAYDPRRPLDPKFQQMIQGVLGQVYEEFVTKTAEARKLDTKKVDAVGGGRVWLGQQALDHGLIDKIGGLDVAISLAIEKAKLGSDAQTRYFKKKDSGLDQLVGKFLGGIAADIGASSRGDLLAAMTGASAPIMTHFERDLQWLANLTSNAQAKGLIQPTAHCFCSPLDF